MSKSKRKDINAAVSKGKGAQVGRGPAGDSDSADDFSDFTAYEGYTDEVCEQEESGGPSGGSDLNSPGAGSGDKGPVDFGHSRKVHYSPAAPSPSSAIWGFLPVLCILVVGTGVAAAVSFVYGGAPSRLWDYSGLTQVGTLLDFQNHPQNMLALVLLGSLLLAGWVGARVALAVGEARSRGHSARLLLEKVSALRLDRGDAWQDPAFKADPALAGFAAETLGAWRHQEARLKRMTGLEGELHRLEKALSDEEREDLAGKFESPAVGILADGILHLFDEKAAAQADLEANQAKLAAKGHAVMDSLHDARGWHRVTLDQVNLQEDALKKASAHMESLASSLAQLKRDGLDCGQAASLIREIRTAVSAAGAGGAEGFKAPAGFGDLLDRITKLAFQIAMEVARLGPRGERLVPMSQTLEELTADFRRVADGAPSKAAAVAVLNPSQLAALDQFEADLARMAEMQTRDLSGMAARLGPTARQAAANLEKIASSFDNQYDRLSGLGQACAGLTGLEFDPGVKREGAASELELEHFDPFLESEPEGPMSVVDPFMSRDVGVPNQADANEPFQITNNVVPGQEDEFSTGQGQRPDPALSQPTEKVYDLAEFGAVPLGPAAGHEAPPEHIYNLSEFGAELLSGPDRKAVGDDRIYDLNEFGAQPLD